MNREFILRDGEIAFNRPDGTVVIMNTNTYLNLKKREEEPKEDNVEVYLKQIAALQEALIKEKALRGDCVAASNQALEDMSKELAALRDQSKKTINNLHSHINEVEKERDEYAKELQRYETAYNDVSGQRDKLIADKNVLVYELGLAKKAVEDLENRVIPKRPLGYMTADGVIIAGAIQPRGGLYLTSTGKLYLGQKAVEKFEKIPTGAVSSFLCGRQNTLRNRKGDIIGIVEVTWNNLFNQPRISDRDVYWVQKLALARESATEQTEQ